MHYFYNFKGFKSVQIDLFRPMTLLIGRNGSGKTNVIEGVELLAQLASGRPLYEISDIGRGSGNTFEVRGGLPGCMRKVGKDQYYPFSLAIDATYVKTGSPVSYQIDVDCIEQPRISNEVLAFDQKKYFEAHSKVNSTDVLDVTYDNFSRGRNKPIVQLPADRSVLSRYPDIIARLHEKKVRETAITEAREITDTITHYLKSAFVFDFNPRLMRQYERIGSTQLRKDGSNLSAILHYIKYFDDKLEDTHQRLLPRILGKLKQLPEESFIDFEFITTQANDVLLAFKRLDDALIDARLLSDGTLRALAILTALETVPEYSRIIIEELDNGIHPSRIKILLETIWECSNRRHLNVLATTHNPATLNGLTPEQLDCVVICHYDPNEKADKLTPLLNLPYSDVLLQKGQLGDLVTRNVLETYLMPHFEEEQQRKAKDWLKSFA